jgi:asparagine synthase (glutamine-hydrolysing)
LKSYSIGFEDTTYNELAYARVIAEKFETDHEEHILNPSALSLTEKLIYHLDEPFGDFSIFPTYLVSQVARTGVKVILSGDGGDELFGGYEHYQAQKISQSNLISLPLKLLGSSARKIPPSPKKKGFRNKIRRFSQGFEHSPELRHFRWMMFLSHENKKSLYSESLIQDLEGIEEIHRIEPLRRIYDDLEYFDSSSGELYLDLKTYLVDDILVKVDRMSMATSLEARVPLLDHNLAEFMFLLPGKLKLKSMTTKWLLKKTMERLLPKENIYRSKEGFSIPMKHWLRTELKDLLLDSLDEKKIREEGLFNFQYIEKMVNAHLEGRENYSHQLWALLVFEIWKDNYL